MKRDMMIMLGSSWSGYNNYPQGEILEKIERNHVYKLFCRFTQKIAKFELNLTVCPWEYLPPQAEEVKGEVKMTNCYMVAPGGRVDIPTENVYKIWAQQAEFGNIPIPDGDVTAELVWQDEQGVIADEGLTVVNASGLFAGKDGKRGKCGCCDESKRRDLLELAYLVYRL